MAEEKQLNETVPGGRYKIGDMEVNAFGEPVKKGGSTETKNADAMEQSVEAGRGETTDDSGAKGGKGAKKQ